MKRFFALGCVSVAVFASLSAQAGELPKTMLVETGVLAQVQAYLARRPYHEVAGLIAAVEGCLSLQVEQAGITRSSGQCSEVSEAIRRRDEVLTAEKKRADEAEAKLKAASESASPASENSSPPRPREGSVSARGR